MIRKSKRSTETLREHAHLSVSVGLELVDPPGADGLVAEGVRLEVGVPEEALVLPEVELARGRRVRRRVDLQAWKRGEVSWILIRIAPNRHVYSS